MEWAWHWLEQGYVTVVDPALDVEHDHTHEGVRQKFRRQHREWKGMAMFAELPPYDLRDLLREWWTEDGGRRSMLRARLSPRRLAELAGGYLGRRSGRRAAARAGYPLAATEPPAGGR
jgi:hypothetical protein